MDTMWSFRFAYNEARKVKSAQDAYCAKAEAGLWESLDSKFPEAPVFLVCIYPLFKHVIYMLTRPDPRISFTHTFPSLEYSAVQLPLKCV